MSKQKTPPITDLPNAVKHKLEWKADAVVAPVEGEDPMGAVTPFQWPPGKDPNPSLPKVSVPNPLDPSAPPLTVATYRPSEFPAAAVSAASAPSVTDPLTDAEFAASILGAPTVQIADNGLADDPVVNESGLGLGDAVVAPFFAPALVARMHNPVFQRNMLAAVFAAMGVRLVNIPPPVQARILTAVAEAMRSGEPEAHKAARALHKASAGGYGVEKLLRAVTGAIAVGVAMQIIASYDDSMPRQSF